MRWNLSEAYEPAGSTGLLSTIVVAFSEFRTALLLFPCGTTALLKLDIVLSVPADSLSQHLCGESVIQEGCNLVPVIGNYGHVNVCKKACLRRVV
jgi:hypothetical protein